jgi:cadmium resistance protein CadD (predicted permease)
MSTSIAGRRIAPVLLTVAVATIASGCEAIGAIFKAGVWTGVIAVVVLIALVFFVVMKLGRS